MYWSNSKVIGYNKLFTFVVGARGCGKTWSSKHMLFKKFIRHGHKFVYLMRYDTELEQATSSGRFFADLQDKFPEFEFKREGDEGLLRHADTDEPWEQVCYFKALSSRAMKALSDPDIKWIVFDEFLPNPGVPYLKNEVEKFLEFYFTISRGTRNTRVLFLGNNTRSVNPYFTYFNIPRVEQGCIHAMPEIVVENVENREFAEAMHNTRFGALIRGTHYADYAVDNKTLADEWTFIEPLPKRVSCVAEIYSQYGTVWLLIGSGKLYVHDKGKSPIKWAVDNQSHNEQTELMFNGMYCSKLIKRYYALGHLRYTNPTAKSIFEQACEKLLKGG